MNIVLLGAPGAGKGTQSEFIVKDYNLVHISTGDIFRQNIKENTPLGIKAKKYIDEGKLVPDSIVIEIVADRIKAEDCKNGFLLDGFPRTVAQAEKLDQITVIDAVIDLEMDSETLLYRLCGRRVCEKCGNVTHMDFIKEGAKCACGGNFVQRKDDSPETIKNRLKVYAEQTKPLEDYYAKKNKLIRIDSGRDKDVVHNDVKAELDRYIK
jgi:adenylate kinase